MRKRGKEVLNGIEEAVCVPLFCSERILSGRIRGIIHPGVGIAIALEDWSRDGNMRRSRWDAAAAQNKDGWEQGEPTAPEEQNQRAGHEKAADGGERGAPCEEGESSCHSRGEFNEGIADRDGDFTEPTPTHKKKPAKDRDVMPPQKLPVAVWAKGTWRNIEGELLRHRIFGAPSTSVNPDVQKTSGRQPE